MVHSARSSATGASVMCGPATTPRRAPGQWTPAGRREERRIRSRRQHRPPAIARRIRRRRPPCGLGHRLHVPVQRHRHRIALVSEEPFRRCRGPHPDSGLARPGIRAGTVRDEPRHQRVALRRHVRRPTTAPAPPQPSRAAAHVHNGANNSARSVSSKRAACVLPPSSTACARSALRCCSAWIFSSTVPAQISL